ncbi:MAG: acyl-CoA dehydrogenase [Burkholderiaceae bacterium]
MQFAPTEEQSLIDDTVERLLASESGANIWHRLAELGLLGAAVPEAFGGADGGPPEQMVLARRLGRHLVSSPYLASAVVGSHIMQRAASADGPGAAMAASALSAMSIGEHRFSLAVFEQATRYDIDALATSATRATGDDNGVVLNGSKHYVLDGGDANTIVVAAGSGGNMGLYAVNPSADGVEVLPYSSVDETPLATVHLNNVHVPRSHCLVATDHGRIVLDEALALGAFGISADILGACEAALEKTVEYLKVREQFGSRLSTFQALQHRASDLHAEIEMLRSLVMGAAQTLAEGLNRQSMSDALAAAIMAAEVGDHVGREAIQMHGAVGMTHDLGVGRYLMRANTLTRLFGDADDCRLRYLALTD